MGGHKQQMRYIGRSQSGFTIVELLIVIVVIGILTTLTLVAFNGINSRAIKASIESGMSSTLKRLELDKVTRGEYTASLNDLANSQSSNTSNIQYQYTGNGTSFCLSGSLNGYSYHLSSVDNSITDGVCAGHVDPSAGVGSSSAEIVSTSISSFRFYTTAGGNNVPISISYNLQPSDLVFVLANADYRTTLSLTSVGGINFSKIYNKSAGTSAYQQIYAFTGTGMSGAQIINMAVCWTSCSTGGYPAGGAYIVYIIHGLSASPTVLATDTSYGSDPGSSVSISPATQQVEAGKVAIFTYTYYGSYLPSISDASQTPQSWTTDSIRTIASYSWTSASTLTALHVIPTSNVNVSYQLTTPASGLHNTGTTLFTIK